MSLLLGLLGGIAPTPPATPAPPAVTARRSFIYPRTIAVRRPNATSATSFGAVATYGGVAPVSETIIASGLPASIQYDRVGKQPDADLPAGVTGRSQWKILIPRRYADLGLIRRGDVIVDDLGIRYSVDAPYWNSLGYGLRVDRLTV